MSEPIRAKESSHQTLGKSPEAEKQTASAQAAPNSVEPVAPQDPQAQGANQGEKHDLLKSNVSGSEQKGAVEQAADVHSGQAGGAGIHSTGSWSGTTHKR